MVKRKRRRTAVRSRKGRERDLAILAGRVNRTDGSGEAHDFDTMNLQDDQRNPHGSSYVDWIIAIVDHVIPEPPTAPISSLKKIA